MRITVTELPEFIRHVDDLLDQAERLALIDYLSVHPKAGDLLQGTGGIRKLRWARAHRGKSGGVRIIYYYHDEQMPLYLLTIFGKNERTNLSQADRNALAKLVDLLLAAARSREHG